MLTRKKARRRTRLERAAATKLVQAAVIKRSLYFLKMFKETLDKFYDEANWVVKIIDTEKVPFKEYIWLGKDPHELINEVYVKWEERNGPIQTVEEGGAGSGVNTQPSASKDSEEGVVGVDTGVVEAVTTRE